MFRRRATTETEDTAAQEPTVAPEQPTGKGRPTPKRSEAEKARKERVRPALNRREKARRDRERMRAERARTRQAMNTGDERYFLKRDQGPVRKFIRDYVDSRRTIAEFFLPIILVILVTSLIGIPEIQLISTLVWVVAMVLLVVDLSILGSRVKREVRRRFPDEPSKGNAIYAVTRATQIRRLRLPKPAVKPGTHV
ncbi:DUF3043 domain-containing protein [Haloactinopolyspora alba]|uniref:DUF3043 domain-containing protein n=1 Tax=Haloactinopolyspora alba TaxID=648780 RepID=UPI000D0E085D|nr:DUF3043 domain-containing protein [Haloactinopolyspora alba]